MVLSIMTSISHACDIAAPGVGSPFVYDVIGSRVEPPKPVAVSTASVDVVWPKNTDCCYCSNLMTVNISFPSMGHAFGYKFDIKIVVDGKEYISAIEDPLKYQDSFLLFANFINDDPLPEHVSGVISIYTMNN